MVEGKLQRDDGNVLHVVAVACYDLSKLLRDLTPVQEGEVPLLTPSRSDDKAIPKGKNKREKIRRQT